MKRPAYVYGLAVVGGFAALGAGVGLAANFTLGFFIEQFVEPGSPPLESTQVGMLFLVSIFFTFGLGPVGSLVAGVGVGRALPDRTVTAAITASVGSVAGFVLYVGLALATTLSVLAEYGSGATGGGGGSPLDPTGLGALVVHVSIPVGLVALATAAITSHVATERSGSDGMPGPDEERGVSLRNDNGVTEQAERPDRTDRTERTDGTDSNGIAVDPRSEAVPDQ